MASRNRCANRLRVFGSKLIYGTVFKSRSEDPSMFRKSLLICSSLAVAISLTAGDAPPAGAKLSAAQIVDKNVAARGGLQAWRAVQTMSMSGKLGAGGNQRATLRVPVPTGQKPGQQMTTA